ncbi:hypothetical protein [Enterococcus sp. BWR-S5]|uniref:hypothetical protein n=1 Tax=Enterococcus sp. BWR-S5 TaxID=2787714 RepID=UPI001923D1EA|nr:hypothetical protein [Enterococcus sp. BWR-S5]MBL1227632.1 hypothetical protein [Enterococcus sp. BWR-S5]
MNNEFLDDVAGFIKDDIYELWEVTGAVLEFYESNSQYMAFEGSQDVLKGLKSFQKDFGMAIVRLVPEIVSIEKRLSESAAVESIQD